MLKDAVRRAHAGGAHGLCAHVHVQVWLANHSRYGSAVEERARLTNVTFERLLDAFEQLSGERNKGVAITLSEAQQLAPSRLILTKHPLPASYTHNPAAMNKLVGAWRADARALSMHASRPHTSLPPCRGHFQLLELQAQSTEEAAVATVLACDSHH